MEKRASHFYEFGPFRLDVVEQMLTREGAHVSLTRKAFQTLLTLVENCGHVVSKDDLMERVWPDACVEEGNLTQNIFTLRKLLGGKSDGITYIETVPRRGYRFLARVKEVRGGGAWAARAGSRRRAVAVLPFTNNSNDPNIEYLCDGMTESIIDSLSPLRSLKVMARSTVFRYKRREADATEVGRELDVDVAIMGRLLQFGDGLTISIELVDAADGSQLWGKRYNLSSSDIFAAQEEILKDVKQNLLAEGEADRDEPPARQYSGSVDAYHYYLKGRYSWNKYTFEGVNKSVEYFRRAIDLDPRYALAHAGLADSYLRLSNTYLPPREVLPQGKSAALRAVSLDEGLAEAHSSLGALKLYHDYDWRGAERELRLAIGLAPGTALAYGRLGVLLLLNGRFGDAEEELAKAQELDPLSFQLLLAISANLYLMGRTGEAIEQVQKVLEIEPNYYPAYLSLGWFYTQEGELGKAVSTLEQADGLGKHHTALAYMGYAFAMSGRRKDAERVLRELKEQKSNGEYISPYHIAVIHAGLGEKERAFDWLEKLYEERSDWLAWLKVSPELTCLRSEQRYECLLRRIGLA
jgi:TolB-like protein/Flp pilus assembly protein TadD